MTAIDIARGDQAALLDELRAAGAKVVNHNAIHCPFHDDKHPSAGVYLRDGVWRFKCQTASCGFNGDVFDIRARRAGADIASVLREANPDHRPETAAPRPKAVFPSIDALKSGCPGQVERVHIYANPDTRAPELVILRWRDSEGRKKFIQCSPVPGGFAMQAPAKPWPIYNRARVRDAQAVVVVEGEKCVEALQGVGIVATTNPGGAGKAEHADWSMLAGKSVYLWPDNDPADPKTGKRTGIEHMRDVERMLGELSPAPRLHWIDPDRLGLPPKGDAADMLEKYADASPDDRRALIAQVLEDAGPMGVAAEVKSFLDDTISGRRRAIRWPWKTLHLLTKALLPGTLTLVCGDPGSAKSFMLLQAAMYWHEQGERVAVLELEEDRMFHAYRALAIRCGMSLMLDDDWVRENNDIAEYKFNANRDFIDSFGKCLHTAPDRQMTLRDVASWIDRMVIGGCRIVAVDPVTAAAVSDKPWVDDLEFVNHVKRTAKDHAASIVLVTHPKKGHKTGGSTSMDDLSGGTAYQRFAQTIIWLVRHHPVRECTVRVESQFGSRKEFVRADRTVRVFKARNAAGAGWEVAFDFAGKELSFVELGAIVKDET